MTQKDDLWSLKGVIIVKTINPENTARGSVSEIQQGTNVNNTITIIETSLSLQQC